MGYSTEMVRLRIQKLKDVNFLRPNKLIEDPVFGKRMQTEQITTYRPYKINLRRQHVFFKNISSESSLQKLMQFCDEHPYTRYVVPTYMENLTLYTQFDVPQEITGKMEMVYNLLKSNGLCSSILIFTNETNFRSKADFNRWNIHQKQWMFESSKIKNVFQDLWDNFISKYQSDIRHRPIIKPSLDFRFDELDAKLLRELSINAKISNKELSEIYGKDPASISRRIQKLKSKVLGKNRIIYDRTMFNLSYQQIIVGKFNKDHEFHANSFYEFMNRSDLPFHSSGTINEESFIWVITLPPYYASELSKFLWKHTQEINIYQVDMKASRSYFFYHKNYLGHKKWNIDDDYVINTPLKQIGLEV